MQLPGKVAVITGAGSGIGRAVAERYAREGATVVIAEVDDARGEGAAGAIRADGGQALFIHADVAQGESVREMVAAAVARCGRIDILVNNAGIEHHGDGRTHEVSEEGWDRIMAVNLRGYWLVAKHVIPIMLAQGGGIIINVASPTGFRSVPGEIAYCTSKGGVAALTRGMAIEYIRENIRVNALVPGFIDTPLNAPVLTSDAERARWGETVPAGRLGTPQDLAGMAVFLATDDARYCVGGFFWVDGGASAQ
jgi:NAD(P)-dependent dehydrogenase (short-subunit alcohol dehydrogenase family)